MPDDAAAAGLALDDTQFQVLNAICLKKMATIGSVADATELPAVEVEAALETLQGRGLVEPARVRVKDEGVVVKLLVLKLPLHVGFDFGSECL